VEFIIMTNKNFDRRDFLKLSALSMSALAMTPLPQSIIGKSGPKYVMVGNMKGVSIHKEATDKSMILYQRYLDDIINVYYEVTGEDGPEYNPLWYRVWGGYVHSANLVTVQYILNPVETSVKEGGQLVEVTVPYTRSLLYSKTYGWEQAYRFYYGSVHWLVDIITGPDDKPWYKIKDELLKTELAAPAEHFRYISDEELSPISPDVPEGKKWIEISLYHQTLKAYENTRMVLDTKISSGLPWDNLDTPNGKFRVQTKMPSKHMGDGLLTSDIHAYELVGVPWNCFFNKGIATHGTFWHSNFGSQMSHGCVNMRTEDAKWLYRWTTPVASPDDWTKNGYGTVVIVN